jgi:hypothetical protein
MDLITIVANSNGIIKNVKKYLKSIGLGDFLTIESSGTFGLLSSDNIQVKSFDTVIDNKLELINRGKSIFVVNSGDQTTETIIDEVYHIIEQGKKSHDTGIAFSVEILNAWLGRQK